MFFKYCNANIAKRFRSETLQILFRNVKSFNEVFFYTCQSEIMFASCKFLKNNRMHYKRVINPY